MPQLLDVHHELGPRPFLNLDHGVGFQSEGQRKILSENAPRFYRIDLDQASVRPKGAVRIAVLDNMKCPATCVCSRVTARKEGLP